MSYLLQESYRKFTGSIESSKGLPFDKNNNLIPEVPSLKHHLWILLEIAKEYKNET